MMKRKEKAAFVQTVLDELFPDPSAPLRHTGLFTLLVAVLLSAQCTDERVNQVTKELFDKASSPEEMSLLPLEEIERIVKPCGLYRNKAKAIVSLSRILVEKFGSRVPCDIEALESLPGVGHKTASVVMAQGFGVPAFPVDTHIHRCAKRWGLSNGKNVEKTEEDLKKLFPKTKWIDLHLQIILYARAYCPARSHVVERCPVCKGLLMKESCRETAP